MVHIPNPSRREFLIGVTGVALAPAAGCVDTDDDGNTGETDGETNEVDGETNGDGGGSGSTDIDLREANVVEVAFEAANEGYTFDVGIHHDDDGEEGYANWWQVERLDGTRLGRRELLHAHSEQPFTRSESVTVPDDVSCVVIRGHDQTHGYGGVAAAVGLDNGAVRRIDQGSDPRRFGASDCP